MYQLVINQTPVLLNINMMIEKEILRLLGRNGMGETTLYVALLA